MMLLSAVLRQSKIELGCYRSVVLVYEQPIIYQQRTCRCTGAVAPQYDLGSAVAVGRRAHGPRRAPAQRGAAELHRAAAYHWLTGTGGRSPLLALELVRVAEKVAARDSVGYIYMPHTFETKFWLLD